MNAIEEAQNRARHYRVLGPLVALSGDPPQESSPWPRVAVEPVSREELATFVKDYLDRRIFILHDLPELSPHQAGTVFLVLSFGGLNHLEPSSIGTIYEYFDKALPQGINGYPMFTSCKLLNMEDWRTAHKIIVAELEQRRQREDAISEALGAKKQGGP